MKLLRYPRFHDPANGSGSLRYTPGAILRSAAAGGLVLGVLASGTPARAQHEPYIVHDTRPVILQGPYLSSLSETTATIVWTTDTPCHARVLYGPAGEAPAGEADNAEHGLLPIGTLHVVHLRGLEPGRAYTYQAEATRVVRMKAYWPEKGLSASSPERTFTTFDRTKPSVSFSAVADTHEDSGRVRNLLRAIDWTETEFLVHLGDAYHGLESEEQLFARWLGPAGQAAAGERLLLLVRGNHEMRGPFARNLPDYLPVPEGRYYYARDHGPLHLIVLDTGEDKPDETNVYAGLNRVEEYRRQQFGWLERHLETDHRAREAPFRVILLHQPGWGWTGDRNQEWTALANRGRVDLVIGGHHHRLRIHEPGTRGNDHPVLVLGQDQIAHLEANGSQLVVTIKGLDGVLIERLTITTR